SVVAPPPNRRVGGTTSTTSGEQADAGTAPPWSTSSQPQAQELHQGNAEAAAAPRI
ncbi:unnamed protein product, partial [Amoebophrya sp. A120]